MHARPTPNAASRSSSSTPLPAAASANTPAKPSPERSVVVSAADRALGAVSVPAPGDTAKVAVRSASGLESMSFG